MPDAIYLNPFCSSGPHLSLILRPLGINVLTLCIQGNFHLSLSYFDLGMSLGTLMYSRMCMMNGGRFLVSKGYPETYPVFCFLFGPHTLYGKYYIPSNMQDYCSDNSHALWHRRNDLSHNW